jgi:hypothetical protein
LLKQPAWPAASPAVEQQAPMFQTTATRAGEARLAHGFSQRFVELLLLQHRL